MKNGTCCRQCCLKPICCLIQTLVSAFLTNIVTHGTSRACCSCSKQFNEPSLCLAITVNIFYLSNNFIFFEIKILLLISYLLYILPQYTGGEDRSGSFNIVERYDPKTECWSFVNSMKRRRAGAGVTVCDGKIYVAGKIMGRFICF